MPDIQFRAADLTKDIDALARIWIEIGWIEKSDKKSFETLIKKSRSIVGYVNNEPECLTISSLGDFYYLDHKLPFSCITGVTTSLVSRKLKLAGKATALKIAEDAKAGAAICGLGMFEQGYYNKLGFGTGNYENLIQFSPADLKINRQIDIPVRLTIDDIEEVHSNRIQRLKGHGACNLPEELTLQEMELHTDSAGLGFRDKDGNLTHHIWYSTKGQESGPFKIYWMAYQNLDQFLDILMLLKNLSDQIVLVKMVEPPGIQLQDFLAYPFLHQVLTHDSKYRNYVRSIAYWQMRILDLEACIEAVELNTKDLSFNLSLDDPIENYLPIDSDWKGISGEYCVTLGKKSKVVKGHQKGLRVLTASVSALTRMWLGVLPASVLKLSENITGDDQLIQALDKAFSGMPTPRTNWDF
tara:strand:- start:222 stop:1457 length:1236 start_codon:yes stop_codon:yes gene_type:complete